MMADPTELEAEIERLRAENDALKSQQRSNSGLSFRISAKGGVSVYGLGRFPVTLYQEQWDRLFESLEELKQFIEENRPKLKKKG
jgi:hypothetical protein